MLYFMALWSFIRISNQIPCLNNDDDEKAEVESYDSELNEIIPDDDLDDVELSEYRTTFTGSRCFFWS